MSLKIQLGDRDVLFFCHVPKAGGTSLAFFLNQQFPKPVICPILDANLTPYFSEDASAEYQQYRLVRGHHYFGAGDHGVYDYLSPNPIRFTVLRDPLTQFISAYRYYLRREFLPPTTDLITYLTAPEFLQWRFNRQFSLFVGPVGRDLTELHAYLPGHESELITRAKANLEACVMVGLTEYFHETLQLLSYIFGWQMPSELPRRNTAPDSFDVNTLTSEVLALIEPNIVYDRLVYEYGKALFFQQRSQMADELYAASQVKTPPIIFNKHAVRPYYQAKRLVWFPNETRRGQSYLRFRAMAHHLKEML
jgi:hypothetical protein